MTYELITPLLLVLCLLLLIILLVRQSALDHKQERDKLTQEHGLVNLGNKLLDELDAQHDEAAKSLYEANQSLMTTLSQMGQGQSTLLESMQRQVLLSTRNQEEKINDLRLENERQLSEMRKTVDARLSESLDKKLDQSFAQVSERLESVYKGLGEMHTLASGVGDLKKVLTNVKTRGIWGEMQLGNLIRQTLAPGQYEENVTVVPGSAERVEFAICLPDQGGNTIYLPVDSKFPQEDYIRLSDASQQGDAAGAEAARKALIQRLKSESKKIAEKYISPPHTTDFAIMFLPVEGLYSEALQTPELVETLQRDYRVVIAGPGTLAAMLNALQMGFRTLAIEKRSGEVWLLLGEIKKDFTRFAEMLENTRRRLDQAGESIDSAVTKSRTIQRKLSVLETGPILDNPPESLTMETDSKS
ncbi:DNA recombination protein RmuC [Aristaeella lactis]|uniref:DNA recombination protein RmuC n=1 Tax=Aristaeella lactis TaxID=3046383 RepID=A0AC61PPC8_9FIRM|nr:DNA recombination protein RmuC [Aristaeella lactis]QUA54474.1 DNA recombination protein RmuC [Aristaeella lactis]SMC82747.1 DNA recombination protein RmuC [Aristaeella lactis]